MSARGLRTWTVLFTDIVGSTELFNGLGDRDAGRVRTSHFDALREQIARFGGREVKGLGDGLMVVFDSATAAIGCGVVLQRDTDASRSRRAPIDIRVGISSGDVEEDGGDFYGEPTVEASRLCAHAAGGQVLVSESTRLLARRYEPLEEIGTVCLKGLAEPTRVWLAPWASADAVRTRVVMADDAVLVREGVAQVLENAGVEVMGQAGDAEELLRLVSELRPDVAIVDVRMPPTFTLEGLNAALRIRAEHPETGVLVLSQDAQPLHAERLRRASATGVGLMLKDRVIDVRGFVEAVRRVGAGGTAFEEPAVSGRSSASTPDA